MVTREQVVSSAHALFGEAKAGEALALVGAYGTEAHEREVERVQLAILEASDGRMARLPYFIACAKIDYRDLLVGARLGPMTEQQEAEWQAAADRRLALWNRKA